MQPEKQRRFAFYLYYAGLLLLVASVPLSKFTMSVAQFMIAAGWLLDGDFTNKVKKFFSPGLALLLASVYLLHIVGLLNTSDFGYAWKDLRIKLPLLLLPLLLSTGPALNKKQFLGVLFAMVGGVTISTGISMLIYLQVIQRPVNDVRDISIFISHIRLSLLCCLSVFSILWMISIFRKWHEKKYYILLLPVILWLVYFMILLESLTGLFILLATGIVISNYLFFRKANRAIQLIIGIISVLIPVSVFLFISSVNRSFSPKEEINIANLETKTPSGNEYFHFPDRDVYENGNHLWIYVCEKELESEWNKRSPLVYEGLDLKKQQIKYTLMRFLTSKGLRKDSAGVWALNPEEIKSIESGIANVDYQSSGSIRNRVHQVLWELHHYKRTGDPSGHSVAQRLEYWKISLQIIKNNLWTGVGTGDVIQAFADQYRISQTKLLPEWQLRSHNQYLAMAVAFGLIGLGWFLFSLFYPLLIKFKQKDWLYISFSVISILSMITEDTLETQAGVTFFALFSCLFLFVNPFNGHIRGK